MALVFLVHRLDDLVASARLCSGAVRGPFHGVAGSSVSRRHRHHPPGHAALEAEKALNWMQGTLGLSMGLSQKVVLRTGCGSIIALLLFSSIEAYRIQKIVSEKHLEIYRRAAG